MSFEAMQLVSDHSPVGGSELLVMLMIANYANEEGYAWPSIATLADKTRLAESTVRRTIKRLVHKGQLEVIARKDKLGGDETNLYRILTRPGDRDDRGDREAQAPAPADGAAPAEAATDADTGAALHENTPAAEAGAEAGEGGTGKLTPPPPKLTGGDWQIDTPPSQIDTPPQALTRARANNNNTNTNNHSNYGNYGNHGNHGSGELLRNSRRQAANGRAGAPEPGAPAESKEPAAETPQQPPLLSPGDSDPDAVPPPTQPRRRAKSEREQVTDALVETFLQTSALQVPPGLSHAAFNKLWRGPLWEIYQLCDQDLDFARRFTREVVYHMRQQELTFDAPVQIIKVARSRRAEMKSKQHEARTPRQGKDGGFWF